MMIEKEIGDYATDETTFSNLPDYDRDLIRYTFVENLSFVLTKEEDPQFVKDTIKEDLKQMLSM